MSTTHKSCESALGTLLKTHHDNARSSYWFCVYEQKGDNPNNLTGEERDTIGTEKVKKLKQLHKISLQQYLGFRSRDQFVQLLSDCGILRIVNRGEGEPRVEFMKTAFATFLCNYCAGAEFEQFKLKEHTSRRWFVRLGPKIDGYHTTPNKQVDARQFDPPRVGGISAMRRTLKEEMKMLRCSMDSSDSSSEEEEEEEEEDV